MNGASDLGISKVSSISPIIPYVDIITNIPTKPHNTFFFPSSRFEASAVMSVNTPHAKYIPATKKSIKISGFNIYALTLVRNGMIVMFDCIEQLYVSLWSKTWNCWNNNSVVRWADTHCSLKVRYDTVYRSDNCDTNKTSDNDAFTFIF